MATSETGGRRVCDVNVMLALFPTNHAHHKAATSWFEHVGAWAARPITGSACCRLLLNPRVTGFELCVSEALDALRAFCSVDGHGLMSSLFCLDHLCSVGPLACGWTTWFTKYGGPTAFKWSNRTQVVQADRGRYDMRDAAPPCETTGGAGRGAETTPDDQPADPAAPNTLQRTRRRLERVIMAGPAPHRPTTLRIAPGKRIQTPPNNLPDEEDSSEQVAGTLMLRIFKTTLLNNLHVEAFLTGNGGSRGRIIMMARMGGREVVRVGLLGRSGAGSCPNLLQRPSAARSAASRSAEYQRFYFVAPARSGPLQQIRTTGVAAGHRGEGRRGPGTARPGTGARPAVAAATCGCGHRRSRGRGRCPAAAAACGCCAYPRSRPWAADSLAP